MLGFEQYRLSSLEFGASLNQTNSLPSVDSARLGFCPDPLCLAFYFFQYIVHFSFYVSCFHAPEKDGHAGSGMTHPRVPLKVRLPCLSL